MEKAISIRCTGAAAIDIEDLSPFQDDIKTMTPSTLKKLENVIISQGFSEPIAVWQNDGRNWILNGHQRHTALQSLRSKGWFIPPIPVAIVEADDEDEARKKVLTLASQFGDFNQDHLLEFVAKARLDTDWIRNNARLAAGDFKWPTLKSDEDAEPLPEPMDSAVVRRGEIFVLGDHRLMCGDSTSEDDVFKLMNQEHADLWLTDPPYGVSYADKNEYLNSLGKANAVTKRIENDHLSIEEMQVFWTKIAKVAFQVTKDSAPYYWFACQGGDQMMMMMMSISDANWKVRHELIWVKNNHVMGRTDYQYKHEPILYGWKVKGSHKFYGGFQTSVLEFDKPHASKLHPTMKPIALIRKLVENSTQANEIVFDSFGGSGTTLMACEEANRKCRTIEIDPLYCGVILDRWQNATGKIAHRDDGETWDSIKATRNG